MRISFTLFITLFIIVLAPSASKAQSFELGAFFGVSTYMGDLNQSDIEVLEINQGKGLFARYNFPEVLSIKAHFYQGTLSGSDANYPTIEWVRNRNLSFRSTIYEAGLQAELSFLRFGDTDRRYVRKSVRHTAIVYAFGGLSAFHFNPQAFYHGQWVDLQPLGTEGQGMPGYQEKYNRLQVAVPMGLGFKINLSKWSSLGLEFGYRTTFTDYLDDVSGNPAPSQKTLAELDPKAAALSFRSGEVAPTGIERTEGSPRGGKANDAYLFSGVTLAISISK